MANGQSSSGDKATAHAIHAGQTTPDGRLSLGTARCLGTCSLAPLLLVDNTVLGREAVEGIANRVEAAIANGRSRGEAPS